MEILAQIRYTRGPQIGTGEGMNSVVFLADDPQLQGPIAVKEIPKKRFGNSLDRYFDEARIMFASSHPNVVPIQYACQTADQVCLAMPYYPAGSLAKRIQSAPLSLKELIRMGDGVLSGLAQVHLKRFLHLDIKPTNVLFNSTPPMLADFGQAREIIGGAAQVPEMYMHAWPPEVVASGIATVESDVFQVGLLLYRAANGEPWYQAQVPNDADLESKILKGKFPDRAYWMPHLPSKLKRVIRKALRIDPAERYHSATEMAQDLARVHFDLDWTVSRQPNGDTTWRATRGKQPDLVVTLSLGTGGLRVETCTEGQNGNRARRPADFCRQFTTEKAAMAHLNWVFAELA